MSRFLAVLALLVAGASSLPALAGAGGPDALVTHDGESIAAPDGACPVGFPVAVIFGDVTERPADVDGLTVDVVPHPDTKSWTVRAVAYRHGVASPFAGAVPYAFACRPLETAATYAKGSLVPSCPDRTFLVMKDGKYSHCRRADAVTP